jgi:hypothetical protein
MLGNANATNGAESMKSEEGAEDSAQVAADAHHAHLVALLGELDELHTFDQVQDWANALRTADLIRVLKTRRVEMQLGSRGKFGSHTGLAALLADSVLSDRTIMSTRAAPTTKADSRRRAKGRYGTDSDLDPDSHTDSDLDSDSDSDSLGDLGRWLEEKGADSPLAESFFSLTRAAAHGASRSVSALTGGPGTHDSYGDALRGDSEYRGGGALHKSGIDARTIRKLVCRALSSGSALAVREVCALALLAGSEAATEAARWAIGDEHLAPRVLFGVTAGCVLGRRGPLTWAGWILAIRCMRFALAQEDDYSRPVPEAEAEIGAEENVSTAVEAPYAPAPAD